MSSIDMERFRNDINRYRRESDVTWAALAEKAGVSPAMFTRIKKGSAVTLEAFAQLCASCDLNPLDYMPEIQTNQHETAKEHPMEEAKKLSIDGKDFTIDDVDIRATSAWANGPRILNAELPDGQILGSVTTTNGNWLWRLAGEDWKTPEPVEGPIAQYIGQEPSRLAAIESLLQGIEDRYATTNDTDPWAGVVADSAAATPTGIDQNQQTDPSTDPWMPVFSDASSLPMPDPSLNPGSATPAGPGIGM
ncbi:MAG: helix-turn-helix transcriptional regulator [Bifidobacterium sp.]|uniref:helix-turn-helix domain-containing protein n=1 Tax=Bifidobacterium sp. TaxID=41200 RepID=UPI00284F1212|nr:helix-turn-helix transcriptional regulator [Bifidobacterium sp.]MDR3912104.1 helix-turn-helix transcriptional regulator [Bifidobacterium sp.]